MKSQECRMQKNVCKNQKGKKKKEKKKKITEQSRKSSSLYKFASIWLRGEKLFGGNNASKLGIRGKRRTAVLH